MSETTHALEGAALRPPVADVVLAAALCLIAVLEVALSHRARLWPDLLIGAVITLPVALRRTVPLLSVLGISAGLVALIATGSRTSQYTFVILSPLIALYSLGSYGSKRDRLIGLAVALAAATASAGLEKGHGLSDVIFAAGVIAVPWTVGLVSHRRERDAASLRTRTEQLEREQTARERAAVAAERGRIARELHDIVAHAVTLMVLQANAGDRQLDSDPQAAHQAFGVIRESGKSALVELRRMLDLLHSDARVDAVTPQPSLDDLDLLVERSRRAGMPVTLQRDVTGEVPESLGVAAYRLIQEALTNANRHAHGAPVCVLVTCQNHSLRVLIQNRAGEALAEAPGSGYGLAGMRERVNVFGGRLHAGNTPDGGFSVDVMLPLERRP
jgi:signal transduction histidine kinase